MSTKYIVILAHAFANRGSFGIEYSSDLREFEDKKDAIKHGFTLNRCDDFNVGEVQDGKLIAIYWMEKRIRESKATLAKIQEEINL